jgi:Flp pilus assembly protein TadG
MGFTLIPVVRAMGAGFELANWYRQKHSMQNAADAATIAAIINGSANYDSAKGSSDKFLKRGCLRSA